MAPYGAQRAILNIVDALDKESFSPFVCSFWGDETLKSEFERAGVEVMLLRARLFLDLRAWRIFFRTVSAIKADIIHTTLPELSVPARLFSIFHGQTRIVHIITNPLSSEPIFWRFLNTATLNVCKAVVSTSEGLVEEILKYAPRIGNKLRVIQNPVKLEQPPRAGYKSIRDELSLSKETKIIGCSGRLTEQKNHNYLLDVVKTLSNRRTDCVFLFAGDGPLEPILKDKAKRLQIDQWVYFLGRRDDIGNILSSLDAYISCSRWESFPLSVVEAMNLEIPCVLSDITGHKELLIDGVTALAFKLGDPLSASDALERILNHPDAANKMALSAKDLIAREYSVEILTLRYSDLYRQITSDN